MSGEMSPQWERERRRADLDPAVEAYIDRVVAVAPPTLPEAISFFIQAFYPLRRGVRLHEVAIHPEVLARLNASEPERYVYVEAALRSLVERADRRGQETVPTALLRGILESMP